MNPMILSFEPTHLLWTAGLGFTVGILSVSQNTVTKTVAFAVSFDDESWCTEGGVCIVELF